MELVAAVLVLASQAGGHSPDDSSPTPTPTRETTTVPKAASLNRRRNDHVTSLRQQWGSELLSQPIVVEELKTHAWRIARLGRLLELAESENRPEFARRVHRLISIEVAMHRRRMQGLWSRHRQQRFRPLPRAVPPSPATPATASEASW